MGQAPFDAEAYRAFQTASWNERATLYHRFFGPVTDQVIDPLLDAAQVKRGTHVLDAGTGPGSMAARAAARGALAVGVDLAEQMVALATALHPTVTFRQADAEHLPFPPGRFEAVVGNFVLEHLGHPQAALAEFVRVLKPGGRLALTVWDGADRHRMGLVQQAIQTVGVKPPAELPPGPPVALEDAGVHLLEAAGLTDVEVQPLAFSLHLAGPEDLWEGMLSTGIRTGPTIRAQTAETQQQIREVFERLARDYVVEDGLELPIAVLLVSGVVPHSRAVQRA